MLKRLLFLVLVLFVVTATAMSCASYEPPPKAEIIGLQQGVLSDSRAPLVVHFGMPVELETLTARVVLNETDPEGNLFDEDEDPDSQLKVLIARDPLDGDVASKNAFEDGDATLVMTPEAALPVGPKLVLVVEAGLKSKAGKENKVRQKITFSYTVKCGAAKPSKLQSGVYFALLEVQEPIGSQIQLYGSFDVDPATGALSGQFTNADRNTAQQCPMQCGSADVCRLLPAPECVAPSQRCGTADEWPDFVPNVTPPTGYSFSVQGCAVDDGEATGVLTAPATMVVESPRVTVEALTLTASFSADGRATGSLVADTVRLGGNPLGAGRGTMTAVRIPDDRVPPNIPRPTEKPGGASDGGSDGGR
jgi:hypothetical protein